MTENEAKSIIMEYRPIIGFAEYREASDIAIKVLEEIQQYRALGTVEELQKTKMQYENINSCAEQISLSGLCSFETAKQSIMSTLKSASSNALEEYTKLGTVEELQKAMEKQKPKKPIEIVGYGMMCPTCKLRYLKMRAASCERCNQKLDWSDGE